ncbi:ABC transporter permease [Jidongwangia harbinensis]|uniref:ABC transporter permease n=1 Tax=Jidongwangia harbinensis TaxID=2878561 RepID=UPI001CD9215A|nr:ABC transporter permease [Jidongwangia harbinensis]MCA2219471.1 ABC transporter permease [Jidongwangia harbinensis]
MLARRVRTQWALLATLLLLVTIGATLVGTCTLLVTRTAGQALRLAATGAPAADVATTVYTVNVDGPGAASVAADTRTALTTALAPFPVAITVRAASRMRSLPGRTEAAGATPETYLSGISDLPARAVLTSGRWPRAVDGRAPVETVVLESTARQLDLAPGRRVRLGAERSVDAAPALDVTVVGIARPRPGTGWERDPLTGAGYDAVVDNGTPDQTAPVYGPFLADLDTLLTSGSAMARLEVTAHPDLTGATLPDLHSAAAGVAGADRRLSAVYGDRVQVHRVDARLPPTLQRARDQQQVAAAVVLAVAVLGCALAATALVLAGRLTAGVRAGETTLMTALGVSRGQFAAAAAVEAGVLAVLAAAVAVPASAALHAGLTHLPPLAGSGLAVGPGTNGSHLAAVTGGALLLASVLVILAVRPGGSAGGRRTRTEMLARSGADLLLVAFAAVGWWQLNGQPTGATTRADAVRVVAPALVLTAGAALVLRVVPPVLRGLDRLARRARGLAFPLAAFEAARRPHAVAAGLLVGLACAVSTFGVAFDATWERAQRDQADLAVGTDLAVAVSGAPGPGDGAAIAAATGGTVSPATDRGIPIGQWTGGAGEPPRLIATDTRPARDLLRGRLDSGDTWAGVGAVLAPTTRVTGVTVPAGAEVRIRGRATGGLPVVVSPRLLMQDDTGMRSICTGPRTPLDGRTYRLPDCATAGGRQLVAVELPVALAEPISFDDAPTSDIAVTLTVPGTSAATAWTATSVAPAPERLGRPGVAVTRAGAGTRLALTAKNVQFSGPEEAARTLVATAFADPGPVPVAMSARLADELGTGRGAELSLLVGTTPVAATVATVLPAVPSAPGAPGVLADVDTLSRALIVNGELAFPLDAWWVGNPATADAAARATALHLGTVTTRAAENARLIGSPPRAGQSSAVRLLVLAAALLLLVGIVLHVHSDLQVRAVELARLRALGVTRREIRTTLLGQHAGVLLPLVAAGAVVGWFATRAVTPLMIRSESGAAAVPAVLPHWPWADQAVLIAVLLAACTLAVAAVVAAQTRRADAAYLRVAP